MPFINCLNISENKSILAIFQTVWNLDGTAWISDLLSVALNSRKCFDLWVLYKGWSGKNHIGKYRVVFTGFYHLIFPNKTQKWEILL
jgi:hypothetical protein